MTTTLAVTGFATKRTAMPLAPLRAVGRFTLLAAFVLATLGCSQSDDGTVNATIIGPTPRLIDPAGGALRLGDAVLLAAVAQGLVRFDARGDIEPGLAERWNVSVDGLSYIFRLA